MLYHFITGHIKGKIPDISQHFKDVCVSGTVKSSARREHQPLGCFTNRDTEKDREYIFLTAERGRMPRLYKYMRDKPAIGELKFETKVFGFVIRADTLRNRPGVYYRKQDCWGRPDAWENYTAPFTDQPLTDNCEVLVHGELPIEFFCGLIEDDKEITDG